MINNVLTLGDARTFCSKQVGDGKAASSAAVLDALNEATQILIQEGHWKDTTWRMKFRITNCTIAMPFNVETVLKIGFDVRPKNVFGMAYEFMASGPGILNGRTCPAGTNLVDMGDRFPTFFGIGTTPRKVAFFSTDAGDIGKEMTVEGFDEGKHELSPSTPGEKIKIQRWDSGIEGQIDAQSFKLSTNSFAEVTHIVKPVTTGYISMMAINEATNEMWFMSKYHPDETRPGYRRYRIVGSTPDREECITALVKFRYIEMANDSDVLLIQNLWALRFMCKSIHQFNFGSNLIGEENKQFAIDQLNKQLTNSQAPGQNMLDVRVDEGASRAITNMR